MAAAVDTTRLPPSPADQPVPRAESHGHFAVLDGWRALSITFVLAGHLLPLGPGRLGVNVSVASTGMALFFILSGFLITKTLLDNPNLQTFAVRRVLRIVPLAWLAMLVLLIVNGSPPRVWAANLLFYANNVSDALIMNGGGHLWSLCVEMQMYVVMALLVALVPRIAVVAIPLMCLAVTLLRIHDQVYIGMPTWYRCDEILAGSVLAIAYAGHYGRMPGRVLARLNPFWLVPLLILSGNPLTGPFQYLRPYIAVAAVGATLYAAPALFVRLSRHQLTFYVATISFALYVIHGMLMDSWLGTGNTVAKYAKRPFLIALTFALAHLSTFRFERHFIDYARRLTRKKAAGSVGPLTEPTASR